ncbi:MAG: hypothetical protein KKC68_08820 [Candidatus Thermoplasmatota archaeon]|nr:hypothetical protein [Candidatus Thermoplasmatota archaeon]MBU1941862.1 hypothetical protein [Candidatus Thermoplasmatota archaeon]
MVLDIEGIKKDATVKMRKALPALVFTIIAAVLIWVFGNLVFMPLAEGITLYGGWPLDKVISFVILIALIAIVLRAMLALTRIADGISTFFAAEMSRLTPKSFDETSLRRYRSFLRGIVYTILIIFIFILIQNYLTYIHPALSGIVLLIIVIWAIVLLYQGGTKIAGEITKTLDYMGEQAVKLLEGEREEKKEMTEKSKR